MHSYVCFCKLARIFVYGYVLYFFDKDQIIKSHYILVYKHVLFDSILSAYCVVMTCFVLSKCPWYTKVTSDRPSLFSSIVDIDGQDKNLESLWPMYTL